MKIIGVYLSIIFITSMTEAKTNLITGQFHHHEIDFSLQEGLVHFDLWRAYNSQNQKVGLFGLGWCSNIEYKLKKNSFGGYDLVWCYKVEKSFRTKNKNQKIFRLPNVSLIIGKKEILYHNDLGADKVFDKKGRLIRILPDSFREPIELSYKKNIEIKLGSKTLKLSSFNLKVTKVNLGKNKVADYRYSKNFLRDVRGLKTKFNLYSYNDRRKLNKIIKKNGEFLEVSYDKNNFVSQISETDVCKEKYSRILIKEKTVGVNAKKVCYGKIFYDKKYIISFSNNNKIKEVRESGFGKVITYDPKNELILSTRTPLEIKKYKYDKKLRVEELSYKSKNKNFNAQFRYGNGNKIKEVLYRVENKKTKVKLSYNKRGQLLKLSGYNKENYDLNYEKRQLASITMDKNKLFYKYDKKKQLNSIQLAKDKKRFLHSVQSNKSSLQDSDQIAGFINSMYMNLGPAYANSRLLREVF